MRGLLLAFMLLWMPVAAGAQSSIFDLDNRLVRFALDQISSPGSFEILAERIDDTENGSTRLSGVSVLDAQGVWLTVEELVVDWNASRILRGELSLNAVVIRGLNMTRTPAEGSEAPELDVEQTQGTPSPFDWPRAPIPIVLEQLLLEDIRIGPDVFGHTITFRADGSAADEGDEQRLSLNVTRTDDIEGDITLNYLRDFAADTLDITLNAQEAAGGAVAALAGLPPDSASQVELTGSGTRTDFDLTFAADSERVFAAEGTATVSTQAPLSAVADFSIDPGPQFPDALRPVIGEATRFTADIAEDDNQLVEVRSLQLSSPALQIEATGTFDRATSTSDLAIFVDGAGELSDLIPAARFEGISFEGRIEGPPDALIAQGQATLNDLQSAIVDAEALVLNVNADRNGQVLNVIANGDARGLRLDELDENTLGEATLRLDLQQSPDGITLRTASLTSPLLELSAQGSASLDLLDLDASFALDARDVGQITRAYDFPSSGRMMLNGDIRRVAGVLDGQIDGVVRDFASAPADVERLVLDIALGQEDEQVRAVTRASATGLRLDRLGPELLGEAELALTVLAGPDEIALRDTTLTSAPLTVTAAGTLEPATGAIRFDYSARTRALEPLAAAYDVDARGRLRADGRGSLTDGVLDTTLEVIADGAAYADLAMAERVTLNANLTGSDDFAYVLGVEAVELGAYGIPAEQIGPATLTARGTVSPDLITLEFLDLDSALVDATARGEYTLAAKSGEGTAQITVPDLAPLSPLANAPLTGSARVEAVARLADGAVEVTTDGALNSFTHPFADLRRLRFDGTVSLADETAAIALDATARGLRVDQLGADVWGPTRLTLDARMTGDGLIVERGNLTSRALEVEVSGDLTPEGDGIAYQATIPELEPLAAPYGQQLTGRVDLQGMAQPGYTIAVDGALTARDLVLNGTSLGTLTLDHSVQVADAVSADLSLTGRGGTLGQTDLRASIAVDGPQINVSSLSGTVAGQSLSGAVRADLAEGPRLDGTVSLSRIDLAALDRTLGLGAGLAGTGQAQVALSAQQGQRVRLTSALNQIEAGALSVDGVNLSADLTDLFGTPRISATAATGSLATGPLVLDGIDISANGPLTGLNISTSISGVIDTISIDLQATTTVSVQPGTTRLTIDTLAFEADEQVSTLVEPVSLLFTGGGIQGSPLNILLPGGGRIMGEIDLIGDGLVGGLELQNVDLQAISQSLPVTLAGGKLNARADFDTRPGRATAELNAAFDKVIATDILDEGSAVNASVNVDWNGQRLVSEAIIQAEIGEPFVLNADLPVRASSGPIPTLRTDLPFTSSLRWAGELRPLWALVPVDGQILSGRATLDFDLSGTIEQTRVGGNISVSDGRYENLDAGLILTELTVVSEFFENETLSLIVQASDGGSGFVSGQLDMQAGDGPLRIASTFTAEQAVLIRRDDLSAQLSAEIGINGPITDLEVAGDVTVDRAELRLVNASAAEIITLGDIRMIGDEPEREPAERPAILRLNIDVNAADGIFVRGRGLESEWQLGLQIRGTATDPRILGRVDRLRGTFSLLGRNFELSRGEVVFDGGQEIDPLINIALTRADRDLVGQILISGSASEPRISFASEPALPEEEVLPQLLFGSSQQSLSAGDALQLAAGIATLVSGSAGPLDVVRGALGVDVLRIDGGSEGQQASLTLGKTIGEGVFVGATTEADGSGAIRIELDVFENVTIDAEVSTSGGSSSLGVTYSVDF